MTIMDNTKQSGKAEALAEALELIRSILKADKNNNSATRLSVTDRTLSNNFIIRNS